jgi:hypothetical protein
MLVIVVARDYSRIHPAASLAFANGVATVSCMEL